MRKMRSPEIQEAIDGAGGLSALARGVERTPSTVCEWKRVPAELVLRVECLSGIPRTRLRPDLYPL